MIFGFILIQFSVAKPNIFAVLDVALQNAYSFVYPCGAFWGRSQTQGSEKLAMAPIRLDRTDEILHVFELF